MRGMCKGVLVALGVVAIVLGWYTHVALVEHLVFVLFLGHWLVLVFLGEEGRWGSRC